MKKYIASLAVAGLLAFGGTAKADPLGLLAGGTTGGSSVGYAVDGAMLGAVLPFPVTMICGIAADQGSSVCKSIGIYPNATTPHVASLADFQAPIMAQAHAMEARSVNVKALADARLVHDFNVAMGYRDDVQTAAALSIISNQ